MSVEGLRIDITAQNKQALAAFNQTTQGLNQVTATAAKTDKALSANSAAVKGNNTAYMNLGRVLQDLPYGFNGVANNLTQLIPSVGALGLAFSGVVTAITFAQVGFGAWTRGLTGSKDALAELEKKMQDFRGEAAKEIINFQRLADTAANANIPLQKRKDAVTELQEQYPSYLGNMSQEDILAGKIGGAYDDIVTALKAKVALQAAEEKLIPIIKEQLAVAERMANAQKTIQAASGLTAVDFERSTMNGRNFARELQAAAIGAAATLEKESAAYKELDKQIKNAFKSMSALNAASAGLTPTSTGGGRGGRPAAAQVDSPFRQLRQGNTIESGNPYDPTALKQLGEAGSFYVTVQAQMLQNQDLVNASLEQANFLADMGAGLFSNMANAFLYGQDMGDALASALKAMVAQLTAAIAKAVILQGVLAIISGGSSVAVGQLAGANIAGTAVQGGGFGRFLLRGADLIMSGQRSGVANTRRRGG